MLQRLARVLSEPVMGFLALAALVFGVAPALFVLPPRIAAALDAGECAVIALFALEYAVHFLLARDKLAYVRTRGASSTSSSFWRRSRR